MFWQTSRRHIPLDRTLVMAILNVTPDSFSDGGAYHSADDALRQVEQFVAEGADIIDVGGESTRPGSARVAESEETLRVVPVIEAIVKRFDVPVSVDTSKSAVARRAVDVGAEIVNDISALRFDAGIAETCAESGAGIVLMHSRGEFEDMHDQPAAENIFADVVADLGRAIAAAEGAGVKGEQIVLDVGLGFGKTFEQNMEMLGGLHRVITEFASFPMLVGASRKSFIGKILAEAHPSKRVSGSVAAAVIAVMNGARIVRVHDVKETVDAVRVADAIKSHRR